MASSTTRRRRTSPRRTTRTPTVVIDGRRLSLEQVERVADGAPCRLAAAARRTMRESRRVVERAVESGDQIYGVNTGFGQLAGVRIPDHQLAELQLNLVRSHAAGVGSPLDERVVRAILVLRANCLARGHSGLRVETVERILELLTAKIHPLIPAQGSVVILRNQDVPGVIGQVGTVLGSALVNIAYYHQSRSPSQNGVALAAIAVDQKPTRGVLAALEMVPDVVEVRFAELDQPGEAG